jgi:hypothetical protein
MEVSDESFLLVAVDLVGSEEKRLSGANQEAREFAVGTCDFGASVDDNDDGSGLVECDARLAEDFRGNEFLVFGDDPARIDDAELVSAPLGVAVEAVARDARLVADYGAARSSEAIEERRLANVGASDDGDERERG